jgi:N-carbamoyl-L-amino-acid hydrolase
MGVTAGNVRIDGRRLWDLLMEMARIGATPKGGVRRLALSAVDKEARDRFRALCEAEGLTVTVDAIGNMFARREGRNPGRKPVMFGSHLDSQPSGGKFDGALGVLGGLEVIRTLNERGIETEAPLILCNWTDEEGSRFGHSLMGSGVWVGTIAPEKAYALADTAGITVGEALERIGYKGDEPPRAFAADSYFELHIEQGPILEAEEKTIGIVTGAQAMAWYDLALTGRESHAGTTPPSRRRDALVGAARVIALVDRLMRGQGEDGRGTVGYLAVEPNSRNVVPGTVTFSAEFRHPTDAVIDALDRRFESETRAIAAEMTLDLAFTRIFRYPAQAFDAACVALVREAARRLGYPAREIVSGAGHDACAVARIIPTAMIFVPCKDGLSHNEAESILPEHAAAGAQVLFEAVLARANRIL